MREEFATFVAQMYAYKGSVGRAYMPDGSWVDLEKDECYDIQSDKRYRIVKCDDGICLEEVEDV